MNNQQTAPVTFLQLILGPWLDGTAGFLQDDERIIMQTLAQEELAQAREQNQALTPEHVIRIDTLLRTFLLARRANQKALHGEYDDAENAPRVRNAEAQIAAKAHSLLSRALKDIDSARPKQPEPKLRPSTSERITPTPDTVGLSRKDFLNGQRPRPASSTAVPPLIEGNILENMLQSDSAKRSKSRDARNGVAV